MKGVFSKIVCTDKTGVRKKKKTYSSILDIDIDMKKQTEVKINIA